MSGASCPRGISNPNVFEEYPLAKFECYDQTKKVIGSFMVFKDKVIFDELSVKGRRAYGTP